MKKRQKNKFNTVEQYQFQKKFFFIFFLNRQHTVGDSSPLSSSSLLAFEMPTTENGFKFQFLFFFFSVPILTNTIKVWNFIYMFSNMSYLILFYFCWKTLLILKKKSGKTQRYVIFLFIVDYNNYFNSSALKNLQIWPKKNLFAADKQQKLSVIICWQYFLAMI